ncbi:MAG: hypothetical protein ACRBCL_04095 [Maritimibacter sp.]
MTQQKSTPMTQSNSALRGAILSESGTSLPDLWRIFHANSQLIERFSSADTSRGNGSTLKTIADAEDTLRQELMSVQASDWSALCHAAGWTLTGAATLSWCKGVTTGDVWGAWAATNEQPEASAMFLRAARALHPACLPKGLTLSQLLEATQNDLNATCATVAMRQGGVRMDLSASDLDRMPAYFAAFLADPAIGLLARPTLQGA